MPEQKGTGLSVMPDGQLFDSQVLYVLLDTFEKLSQLEQDIFFQNLMRRCKKPDLQEIIILLLANN